MLGWSINLFRIAGIRLALHWSLLLLFGYVTWEAQREAGLVGGVWMALFFVLLFTTVLLHELGHCLAAQRYGVAVERILLLPIGGMAQFDRMPRRPRHEFIVALAGPGVNFLLIALLLLAGVHFPARWEFAAIPLNWAELGRHLLLVNLVMGCFNLIPAFPMDGGRVVRAVLATRLSYMRATWFAATLGKLLAVLGAWAMIVWLDHWLGALLFCFIFLAGEAEYRVLKRHHDEEMRWQALLRRFGLASADAVRAPPPKPAGDA